MRAERIKQFATALNNLGVGAILAGVIVPIISGQRDPIATAVWLGSGVDLMWLAYVWLGRL
jgi:hypothetical protein